MPSASGPAALSADGIGQLIERITVEGFHRVRQRNERFFDLRGADVDFLTRRWTLNNLPALPSAWSFTASATNEFRRHLLVPFVPMGISPKEQQTYLLDVPNYDTLKLTIQWGDVASVFGTYTNAPTLSAYGSATGVPKVRVAGLWALAGPSRFVNRIPGRMHRYFVEISGSLLTTSATAVRLVDIPRGNIMRSITMKTGVKQTVSSGNNAFASVSDSIFSTIKINRGINRPVRVYSLFEQIRLENVLQSYYSTNGTAVVDFARNGALSESFDARPLVAGPSGQVDFFIESDVTGAANQAAVFIWEELQSAPVASTVRA